ncbi:immunity 26/phosphotriesterase HocA family protein [Vibrio sp. ZSDE26]|uniref:Immunity 26/phosphotriesterase HocA family protein n=1 Tax=Vibrio amylolyticus TaxID=2847292 RepID=A0A9X1XRB9_9VIBR|nr:Imm26 family immunity protein [Vibrio amylolyticus]MCK6265720.1 immunity 26/phosphotriesterase HocA family protein [Vibrio amylolyticus]
MVRAKKIKRKVGDVLAIKLEDGSFSFGRVLEEPLIAFYDCKSVDKLGLEEIVSKPVIFKVWVMNSGVTGSGLAFCLFDEGGLAFWLGHFCLGAKEIR